MFFGPARSSNKYTVDEPEPWLTMPKTRHGLTFGSKRYFRAVQTGSIGKDRANCVAQQLFTLLTSMSVYLTGVVTVLQCMRPLVSVSPHLGGMVRERESSFAHTVSPLVSVGLYMCVTLSTFGCKCFKLTTILFCRRYNYIHTCWRTSRFQRH